MKKDHRILLRSFYTIAVIWTEFVDDEDKQYKYYLL